MNTNEYMDDILDTKWKHKISGKSVDNLDWDGFLKKFAVTCGCITKKYTYKEFYNNFVESRIISHWHHIPKNKSEQSIKEQAGWLTLLKALSICDGVITVPKDMENSTNESVMLSTYVNERIEDVEFSLKHNVTLPWDETKEVNDNPSNILFC